MSERSKTGSIDSFMVGIIWVMMIMMSLLFVGVLLDRVIVQSENVAFKSTDCLEYADASVARRLCLEEDGIVLYTWGRDSGEPIRQVLNVPTIE
jgi:hypothetical protein